MQPYPAPLDEGFEILNSSPRRVSRRARLVLLAVLVVVAAIGGVHWLTRSTDPIRITAYGQPVADPGTVLSTAQHVFQTYTAGRHGALGKHATCWFQRDPGSSDVAGMLLCGPVLFYDDDPTAPYLRFPLIARGTATPVHLDVASRPVTPEPSAVPSDVTLVRPDAESHPVQAAGISAPLPPPAAPDTLAMTDTVRPLNLVQASPSADIGADLVNVRLDDYGPVTSFGSGSAERSAPKGMQLFAFHLVFFGGENGFARLSDVDLAAAVGAADPRPLPLPDKSVNEYGQLFVIAVPATAPIDLVLTEHGISQRLSLRDGQPAKSNIVYLRAPHSVDAVPKTVVGRATIDIGGRRQTAPLYVGVDYATQQFFLPGSAVHPSRADHVFLSVHLFYMSQLLHTTHVFSPSQVTLTPRHGSPIPLRLVGSPGVPTFEVPANLTDATITITGSDAQPGYVLRIPTPIHVPLELVPDGA